MAQASDRLRGTATAEPAYDTRLERFRLANDLPTTSWASAADLSRQSFLRARAGRDIYLRTLRVIVRSARELVGRPVEARELFDLGEDTTPTVMIQPTEVAEYIRAAYKRYPTNLDRILRGEQIAPTNFGEHVQVARQTLLRYRAGQEEPSLFILGRMVRTLRQMTGKPYRARHLYDVGELATAL